MCVVLNKEINIVFKFFLVCLILCGIINFNILFDIYVLCWKNIFVLKSINCDFDLYIILKLIFYDMYNYGKNII